MVRLSIIVALFFLSLHQREISAEDAVPVRKEIRSLTKDELGRYFNAIRQWQDGEVPEDISSIPNYATFVALHGASTEYYDDEGKLDRMHFGSHFLPMHGALMLEFEKGIRYYDPTVAAHYWDWTTDPARIFKEDYVGEYDDQDGTITNGYLKDWPVTKIKQVPDDKIAYLSWLSGSNATVPPKAPLPMDPESAIRAWDSFANPSSTLGRAVGVSPFGVFAPPGTKDQVSTCVAKPSFKEHWCCVFFEDPDKCSPGDDESTLHGLVHAWYAGFFLFEPQNTSEGGYMYDGGDIVTSPNDPVWLLHHSQVERMHQAWQFSVGTGIATPDDPCGKYNVPNFTQVRLHGLYEPLYPQFSSTANNPAEMCLNFYRGDPLYVYDSYPDGIEPPTPEDKKDIVEEAPSAETEPESMSEDDSGGAGRPFVMGPVLSIVTFGLWSWVG